MGPVSNTSMILQDGGYLKRMLAEGPRQDLLAKQAHVLVFQVFLPFHVQGQQGQFLGGVH